MPEPIAEEESARKTLFDKVYDAAMQWEKPISLKDIQALTGLDDTSFRTIMETFNNAHVFEVKNGRIVFVRPPEGLVRYEEVKPIMVIEERPMEWRGLSFQVKIYKIENEIIPLYYVPPIKIGNGLKVRLKNIFYNFQPKGTEKGVPDKKFEQKDLLKHLAIQSIERELGARAEISDRLSDILMFEFVEVGCLDLFLQDKDIEEVVFNGENNPLSVYSCRYGWVKTNIYPTSENSLFEIATRMVRLVQKEINFSNPVVETRLPSGDRVNTLLSTVSPQGTIITVRKFSRDPWTIVGLIKKQGTTSIEIAALLWFAVEYGLNILLAGGSGSGKTTLLNAVCNLIPPSVHVLSIETVREIHIPESRAWNWLSLVSRDEPNREHIDTSDLMGISLKMRPERIVLGEAVRTQDIRSLFQAMQIGHPVYSTIHATSSNELLRRVMDPIYQIPRTDINSLDLVLVMYHDLREKTRALIEVSEVTNAGLESETDIMANLYTYSPKAKTYIQISKPKKIFEKVQKKTGMSDEEVDRDMREKTMVLQWAMDNDITDMRQFEDVIQGYYSNRPQLLERIRASMKN